MERDDQANIYIIMTMAICAMKDWVKCYQIALHGELKLSHEAGTSRRKGRRNFQKMESEVCSRGG